MPIIISIVKNLFIKKKKKIDIFVEDEREFWRKNLVIKRTALLKIWGIENSITNNFNYWKSDY